MNTLQRKLNHRPNSLEVPSKLINRGLQSEMIDTPSSVNLYDEIIHYIAAFLDDKSILTFSIVNRHFNTLLNDNIFWRDKLHMMRKTLEITSLIPDMNYKYFYFLRGASPKKIKNSKETVVRNSLKINNILSARTNDNFSIATYILKILFTLENNNSIKVDKEKIDLVCCAQNYLHLVKTNRKNYQEVTLMIFYCKRLLLCYNPCKQSYDDIKEYISKKVDQGYQEACMFYVLIELIKIDLKSGELDDVQTCFQKLDKLSYGKEGFGNIITLACYAKYYKAKMNTKDEYTYVAKLLATLPSFKDSFNKEGKLKFKFAWRTDGWLLDEFSTLIEGLKKV